jgi:hypothetical protein
MRAIVRASGLIGLVLAAVGADGMGFAHGQGRGSEPWKGACYCRAAGALECTPDLTERECRRRCDEALADDWFWKERLPCWNWGYGG